LNVLLTGDLVVFGVRPYPDPVHAAFDLDCERAVVISDTHGPMASESLKMKRRMPRVSLQQLEILVGKLANLGDA